MRQATVNGPTHPGTGVILFPASSILLKSASPYIWPSITVNHTSITIELSLSISFFKSHGTQVATTTISAFLVCVVRSFV